jgi:hypothetical protein
LVERARVPGLNLFGADVSFFPMLDIPGDTRA